MKLFERIKFFSPKDQEYADLKKLLKNLSDDFKRKVDNKVLTKAMFMSCYSSLDEIRKARRKLTPRYQAKLEERITQFEYLMKRHEPKLFEMYDYTSEEERPVYEESHFGTWGKSSHEYHQQYEKTLDNKFSKLSTEGKSHCPVEKMDVDTEGGIQLYDPHQAVQGNISNQNIHYENEIKGKHCQNKDFNIPRVHSYTGQHSQNKQLSSTITKSEELSRLPMNASVGKECKVVENVDGNVIKSRSCTTQTEGNFKYSGTSKLKAADRISRSVTPTSHSPSRQPTDCRMENQSYLASSSCEKQENVQKIKGTDQSRLMESQRIIDQYGTTAEDDDYGNMKRDENSIFYTEESENINNLSKDRTGDYKTFHAEDSRSPTQKMNRYSKEIQEKAEEKYWQDANANRHQHCRHSSLEHRHTRTADQQLNTQTYEILPSKVTPNRQEIHRERHRVHPERENYSYKEQIPKTTPEKLDSKHFHDERDCYEHKLTSPEAREEMLRHMHCQYSEEQRRINEECNIPDPTTVKNTEVRGRGKVMRSQYASSYPNNTSRTYQQEDQTSHQRNTDPYSKVDRGTNYHHQCQHKRNPEVIHALHRTTPGNHHSFPQEQRNRQNYIPRIQDAHEFKEQNYSKDATQRFHEKEPSHMKAEEAKEAIDEEPLEILDVHQYFTNDYDLKTLDDSVDIMTQITTVEQWAKSFEDRVSGFKAEKYSLEYFVLDEKLMRLIEHLDKLKCKEDQSTTAKKIEVIQYIKNLHCLLDANAKDDD